MSNAEAAYGTAILRLGKHPRRRDHAAILDASGRPVVTFGAADTRAEISAAIAAGGYVLQNNHTIAKALSSGLPQATARDGPSASR